MKRSLTDLETMRAHELLVQRATEGLDPEAAAELARLGAADVDSFDLAAAAVAVAAVPREPLPAELAAKLLAAAPGSRAVAAPPTSALSTAPSVPSVAADLPAPALRAARSMAAPRPPRGGAGRNRLVWGLAASGWLAAAAVAAVALTRGPAGVGPAASPPTAPSVAGPAPFAGASASELVTLRWRPGGDAAGAGVAGEVVWSPTGQRGQARLTGLAVNDPAVARYQVWIVDRTRDERFPVDGGRFDVSAVGEQVITIEPRLPIGAVASFAITLETPAGVVVSSQDRVVARAAP